MEIIMSLNRLDLVFKMSITIALTTAFYNVYQGWFYDHSSSLLLYITLFFSIFAASVKENIKKNTN